MLEKQVILPSKGYLYNNLLPDGKVLIKPLTTKDEKILLSGNPQEITKAFDRVLQGCCSLPRELPFSDLLCADRLFLIFQIRFITYGEYYFFSYQCGNCGFQNRIDAHLPTLLAYKEWNEPVKEPFLFTAPISKDTIGFRLLRGKDEAEIERYTKTLRGAGIDQEAFIYRISLHIQTINNNVVNRVEALHYVEDMIAGDNVAFQNEIREKEPGYDTFITLTCDRCRFENEMVLPTTVEFFRPGITRRGTKTENT